MKTNKKGFSLIELLVVIAIIGILSSVVMVSLNSARAKGRDAKRITDVKQLSLALALYYDACGRQYPSSLTPVTPDTNCPSGTNLASFINPVPLHPTGGPWLSGAPYGYFTNTARTDYILRARLETKNTALDNDIDDVDLPTGFTAPLCNDAADPYYYCVGS
jgi:prepilin-type N-terminal cleavage/methylation domain-containing protein